MTLRLVVVGGGRMGEALVGGLLRAGWAADQLALAERADDRLEYLASEFPGVSCTHEPPEAEGAVIAVKPNDAAAACRTLRNPRRVLSIAAGVSAAVLAENLPSGVAVIRSMPNTPALVGAGAAAIAAGPGVSERDLAWAEEILGAVGLVVRVDEPDLDAVTGLSGSGPAYVFHLAEALMKAGEAVGLAPEVSRKLTLQTILGAARMLTESGQDAAALREAVTSPNGTTAAGLAALAARGFTEAVVEAVTAASQRSRELGQA